MTRKLKFPKEWLEERLPLKTYRENWQRKMGKARLALRTAFGRLTCKGLLTSRAMTYLLVFFLTTAAGMGGYLFGRKPASWEGIGNGEEVVAGGEMAAGYEAVGSTGEGEDGLGAEEVAAELGSKATEGIVSVGKGGVGENIAVPLQATGGDGGEELPVVENEPLVRESGDLPGTPVSPVAAPVSSPFGWRLHPVFGDWRHHPGVDLAAEVGTPIQAALGGIVKEIYEDRILGRVIILGHGPNYETCYGHCQDVLVETNRPVIQGDVIATVGETGLESGPHLHFELRCNGQALDPAEHLPFASPSKG